MNKELYKNDIEKIAGIGSALKSTGKFMGRTATGLTLGAGIGAMKGLNANAQNPNLDQEGRESNIMGNAVSGALIGGVAGGVGIGLAKKLGKGAVNKLTPGFMKKSEMEVPTDEEKGLEDNEDKDEVQESPNKEEVSRMRGSINKHKEQIEKKSILKQAKYMQDVTCEKCGFEVTPNSEDGRCPNCGALGGILPKPNPSYTRSAPIKTKDETMGSIVDSLYAARQGLYMY